MHNEDVAHEHSDINSARVLAFGAGLARCRPDRCRVDVRICSAPSRRRPRPAIRSCRRSRLPAGETPPATAAADRMSRPISASFAQEETSKLEGYGWMDESAGIAHVPIEDAKKLLAPARFARSRTGPSMDPTGRARTRPRTASRPADGRSRFRKAPAASLTTSAGRPHDRPQAPATRRSQRSEAGFSSRIAALLAGAPVCVRRDWRPTTPAIRRRRSLDS